jgi:hypothetical protein
MRHTVANYGDTMLSNSSFGGLSVDLQKPGTVMVATLNQWWPDANIFRTTDGGMNPPPYWIYI